MSGWKRVRLSALPKPRAAAWVTCWAACETGRMAECHNAAQHALCGSAAQHGTKLTVCIAPSHRAALLDALPSPAFRLNLTVPAWGPAAAVGKACTTGVQLALEPVPRHPQGHKRHPSSCVRRCCRGRRGSSPWCCRTPCGLSCMPCLWPPSARAPSRRPTRCGRWWRAGALPFCSWP